MTFSEAPGPSCASKQGPLGSQLWSQQVPSVAAALTGAPAANTTLLRVAARLTQALQEAPGRALNTMSSEKGSQVSGLPCPSTAKPPAQHSVGVLVTSVHPFALGLGPAHTLPLEPQENPKNSKDPKTKHLHFTLLPESHLLAGTQAGSPDGPGPSAARPTHLPLGFVQDAVHGVEQCHALVELEHLLLRQLQMEAQRDTGLL